MSLVDECLSLPAPYTTPATAPRNRFHHVPRVSKKERKPRAVVIAEGEDRPGGRPKAKPVEAVNREIPNVRLF